MINYKQKRQINFLKISVVAEQLSETPSLLWICQSYLFAFFSNCYLIYVSLNFFDCLYFSINWPADGGIG